MAARNSDIPFVADSSDLPVVGALSELRQALGGEGAAVLEAPPGAGKSTLVPLALLGEPWLQGKKILMLEPRRLATRAVASRMSELLHEPIGATVGYRVRFESQVGSRTRLEVMTEGILTRLIQRDPELHDVGLVIFDEFHERNLHSDLALALCLEARGALREDLRLLVMSATLEDTAGPVSELLGRAPIISSTGRMFPVKVRHLTDRTIQDGQLYPAAIARVVVPTILETLATTEGDILVFLPGAGEIGRVERGLSELRQVAQDHNVIIRPLYGELGRAAQDVALRPDPRGRRKVLLATPIAETSLTIEGVRVVIDSGLRRAPRYDAGTGLSRLELLRVSRAQAEQRAGRAGRMGPGQAIRLWSSYDHDRLAARATPEILDADLAGLVLELAAWGVAVGRDRIDLPFLDPPPTSHIAQARELLLLLGALERADTREDMGIGGSGPTAVGQGGGQHRLAAITPIGRAMVRLPVHPRLARMLVASCAAPAEPGRIALAADLAALLSERDPLRFGPGDRETVLPTIGSRLEALFAWRQGKSVVRGDDGNLGAIDRVARQLRKLLVKGHEGDSPGQAGKEREFKKRYISTDYDLSDGRSDESARLLATAYPDRIAMRRSAKDRRYRLTSGRGAELPEPGPGQQRSLPEFLIALDLDAGPGPDARIRLMAPITRDIIEEVLADRLQRRRRARWEANRVMVNDEICLGAVVLRGREIRPDDDEIQGGVTDEAAQIRADITAAMLEGVREILQRNGTGGLARDDRDRADFESLCTRIEFLRAREFPDVPELAALPDLSEENLVANPRAWLQDHLSGYTRLDDFRRAVGLADIVRSGLTHATLRKIDEAAPTHIGVPGGARIRLRYTADEAVLAVKLQELFGLTETPRVALGREPVTLHLLSPARRPIQVTRDLAGFWERTYREVKKELKGRYPRHAWPDNPLAAPKSKSKSSD